MTKEEFKKRFGKNIITSSVEPCDCGSCYGWKAERKDQSPGDGTGRVHLKIFLRPVALLVVLIIALSCTLLKHPPSRPSISAPPLLGKRVAAIHGQFHQVQ